MAEKHKAIDMEKTSEKLAKVFEQKGMTYSDIAKEFGVSVSTVSYWMNGKKLPSLSHIVEIAGLVGCTIDDLIVSKS